MENQTQHTQECPRWEKLQAVYLTSSLDQLVFQKRYRSKLETENRNVSPLPFIDRSVVKRPLYRLDFRPEGNVSAKTVQSKKP